ncbi:MAG: mechanosensitive ion channel family protein, partial [Comamonadaceae bacterium]|nr:mechanosensitive ion channel family protein [Comamonadaceae bacterium]
MRALVSLVCIATFAASAWAQPARTPVGGAAAASATAAQTHAVQGLPAASGPARAASAAGKPAEVRVGDTVVFTLRAARAGLGAAARARAANEALREALRAAPADVHVEPAGDYAVVYVGARPVVQLTPQDAALAGDAGLAVHADRVAAEIATALAAERSRSALAGAIFNSSLAVLFAVLALFLLRRAWQLADRAGRWLAAHPERVGALHLRTIELLNPATVRTVLRLALAAGRWIVLLGLVYAWLIATLSLFEATRGFTSELSGALLAPLATLAARSAAALPLAVVVALALAALALVLRAVRLFFGEVARGAVRLAWLPQDLAAATGMLVELGLVTAALLLVAPVITGNDEGAAPRIG